MRLQKITLICLSVVCFADLIGNSSLGGELVPLYPKIVKKLNVDEAVKGPPFNPQTDAYLTHNDGYAEYYLGSGAENDTFFVVFDPSLACSVLYAEVLWYTEGEYTGFAALYNEEASIAFPSGQAPPRGTTDISPIGDLVSGWVQDSAEYSNDWVVFNFGDPFLLGNPVTHEGEMFGIGYVKHSDYPKLLADAVSDYGIQYSYSWFGGPWMPNNNYDHTWGAYTSDFSGVVIEYMIRVWVNTLIGGNCCEISLTPENPPITIPAEGGYFNFQMTAINFHDYPLMYDIWTTITMPDSTIFGPIINIQYILPASGLVVFDESQEIPSSWQPGDYNYNAYIGYYPHVSEEDHFSFSKSDVSSVEIKDDNSPIQSSIINIHPNPFNASTAISYRLSADGVVNLTIYDITGREVAKLVDGMKPAGSHQVIFDGSDLVSGVYFARLKAGGSKQVRKMLLLK